MTTEIELREAIQKLTVANTNLRRALTIALSAWTQVHEEYVPYGIEEDTDYQDVMALRNRAKHGIE